MTQLAEVGHGSIKSYSCQNKPDDFSCQIIVAAAVKEGYVAGQVCSVMHYKLININIQIYCLLPFIAEHYSEKYVIIR